MTTLSTRDTATGADAAAALTDGYHLVVEALKLNDVHTIYGVVGIPITDVARVAQTSGIRYIGFRHESDAGHAAAAAGFLTKKPGICLTVSAPGFLNGLVALANATTNCFPMVQISGSSERHIVDLKRGDYEELDQLAAAEPFAKAAYRVNRVEDIGRGIARAIRTAVSGRPGGVYLDIPAAVLGQVIDAAVGGASLRRVIDPAPRQLPAPEAVDRAIALLAGAQRPLVVLGKGAAYSQADKQIRAFIEATGLPLPADVDGQGPAARRPPSVGGRRPFAGAARSRCRDARRRPAELAAGPRRGAAVESRRAVHPGRHRAGRAGQQPADRRTAGRRHRLGDASSDRANQARSNQGYATVAR